MEVHAHTHTARKKWTHYFWEFLMLFLAVFCGFLAENQREHYIEHQREIQFINSFINDLEADTARLQEIITNRTFREERLDSLAVLLNSDSALFLTKDIYFLAVTLPRITLFQFSPSDGTMLQLKNSGGLRLIRKRAATDSIVKYDAVIRSLLRLDEQEQEIINIQREIAPKILVSTIWPILPTAIATTPMILRFGDRKNTLPPYSPILLGVNTAQVSPQNTDSTARHRLMFSTLRTSLLHLTASRPQLTSISKTTMEITAMISSRGMGERISLKFFRLLLVESLL